MYEEDIICFVLTVIATVVLGILPYLIMWAVYVARKNRIRREHKIRQQVVEEVASTLNEYKKEIKEIKEKEHDKKDE